MNETVPRSHAAKDGLSPGGDDDICDSIFHAGGIRNNGGPLLAMTLNVCSSRVLYAVHDDMKLACSVGSPRFPTPFEVCK